MFYWLNSHLFVPVCTAEMSQIFCASSHDLTVRPLLLSTKWNGLTRKQKNQPRESADDKEKKILWESIMKNKIRMEIILNWQSRNLIFKIYNLHVFINRLTLVYIAEMRSKSFGSCFHTTFLFAVKKRLRNKQKISWWHKKRKFSLY